MTQTAPAPAPTGAQPPQPVRIEDFVREAPLTAEDEKQLGGGGAESYEDAEDAAPVADDGRPPEWFRMPEGFQLPVGKRVTFIRFRAEWTDYPKGVERQCALWNLTEADEKLASKRCRGDNLRLIDEMSKQMVRVVDGVRGDWTHARGPGSVQGFWDEIGRKCRLQIMNIYAKTHSLGTEAAVDFFTSCVAVRTPGG